MALGPPLTHVQATQNFTFYVPHPSFLHLDGITLDYYTTTHGRGTGNGTAGSVAINLAVYKSDRVTAVTTIAGITLPTTLAYAATGSPDNPTLGWWSVVLPGALVARPLVGLGTAQPYYLTASLVDATEAGTPPWPSPQGFIDMLVLGQ